MLNPDTFQKVDRVSVAFRADLEQLKAEQFAAAEVPLYAVNGGGEGVAGYWVLTTHRVFHVTFQPKDRAFKSVGEGYNQTYLPPEHATGPLKVVSRSVFEMRLSDLSSVTRHDLVLKHGWMAPPVKMIELVLMGTGGGFGNDFSGLLEYDDGLALYKILQGVVNREHEKPRPSDGETLAELRLLLQRRARGDLTDSAFASEAERLLRQ